MFVAQRYVRSMAQCLWWCNIHIQTGIFFSPKGPFAGITRYYDLVLRGFSTISFMQTVYGGCYLNCATKNRQPKKNYNFTLPNNQIQKFVILRKAKKIMRIQIVLLR